MDTLCAPVAPVLRTWSENGHDYTVTTQRLVYLKGGSVVVLCSAAEAAEAGRILDDVYVKGAPADRAERAVRALAARGVVSSNATPTCGG
jgi:hypothetical protein